jgi:hypothetical protein
VNSVRFSEAPIKLDPSSVSLRPVDPPPGLRILSQQFENDVVTPKRLLGLYVGRRIQIDSNSSRGERVVGELIGVADGVTIKLDDGQVRTYRDYAQITFADIPGGLITRPSLIWQIESPDVAFQTAELTYLSAGISWWADYTVTLNRAPRCSARVNGWVNVANASGRSFANATLELVHARAKLLDARSGSPQAQSFPLPRPTDLPTGAIKQLPLLDGGLTARPCAEVFALESSPVWKPSAPILDAPEPSSSAAGALKQLRIATLGESRDALPGGRVRVQLEQPNGSLNLIGWDRLKASRAADFKVELGRDELIRIERSVNDFALDAATGVLEEAITLTLNNASPETADLRVREHLYRWRNWSIPQADRAFERVGPTTIEFALKLKAGASTSVRLVARYQFTPVLEGSE